MESPSSNQEKRNILIRIICALVWLIVTFFAGHMLVGAVVGGIAGASAHTAGLGLSGAYDAGGQAGAGATKEFFVNHGGKVLLAEIILWAVLVARGTYPGTNKFKRAKA